MKKLLGFFIIFLLFLAIVVGVLNIVGERPKLKRLFAPSVMLIDLEGVVSFGNLSFNNVDFVIKNLKIAQRDPTIKGVIMRINSPGGSASACWEIYSALQELRKYKKTVAVIREIGASGGYLISCGCDYIIAKGQVGGIGAMVIIPSLEGMMRRFGINFQVIKRGKYKDIGFHRALTDEEKNIFQELVDEVADDFLKIVKERRKLKEALVEEIKEAKLYSSKKAKDIGLIDQEGGLKEAKEYLKKALDVKEIKIIYKKPTLFDILQAKINLFLNPNTSPILAYLFL